MSNLTALDWLNVWEQGLSATPVYKALYLLAIAYPDRSWDDLAQLSIGRRDALLLTLRECLFGAQLASVVNCPQCGEPLEFTISVENVRLPSSSPAAESMVQLDGYTVCFRLPNSLDLVALEGSSSPSAARWLLQRCILSTHYHDTDCSVEDVPDAVMDAIATQMAADDPQANVQLALTCPACSHQWQSTFDIVPFLWSELHHWAQRTLIDVHRLALAYGWREADILSMSPHRRQFYLGMVNR